VKNPEGKYSVITFATNQLNYASFALNCARSVLLHNDLPVYIVSNLDFPIPERLQDRVFIIPAKPEQAALGIGIKLYTDQYLQTEHTLFIDSDCLCYGDLGEIFNACEGMGVSVVGNIVPTENWCGDKQARIIKDNWGISNIIRYNGGLYYFKKSRATENIFDKAREIAEKYDDYGFERLKKNWMNEEGPLSIAMMLNNQRPIEDTGRFMTDLFTDHRPRKLNVLSGSRILRNPARPHPKHRPWYTESFSPILLHFGGSNLHSYPYRSQSLLLKLHYAGIPSPIATAFITIFIHWPYKIFHWLTGLLRNSKIR
jgi:hypothetical protein